MNIDYYCINAQCWFILKTECTVVIVLNYCLLVVKHILLRELALDWPTSLLGMTPYIGTGLGKPVNFVLETVKIL